MSVREFGAVVLLAAIWGVSFLLIRITAPVLGPMLLVTVRMLIAGGFLWLYAAMTRQPLPVWHQSWKALMTLGVINSALPLMLEAIAVLQLNASLTAVLATTTPLFTALVAAIWLRERLTASKAIGLVFGLLGVGLLVGWSPVALTWATAIAVGAALLSSMFYAVAAMYAKTAVRHISPLPLAIGQELTAGVLLLPFTLTALPAIDVTMPVIAATGTLALLMTAGGNLLYYHLIARVGPTKTQIVAFLIPVFALLAGVIVLDEPFTTSMAFGLGVILLSVVLVLEIRVRPRAWGVRVVEASRSFFDPYVNAVRQRVIYVRQAWGIGMERQHPSYAQVPARVLYDRHSAPARSS